MKYIFSLIATLFMAHQLLATPPVEVGLRTGANLIDNTFETVTIGDMRFSEGTPQLGYDVGFVVRINLGGVVHLQSEFNYMFANYAFRIDKPLLQTLSIDTERLQVPLMLGFQLGHVRLFGGVSWRISQSQSNNYDDLLDVDFNDDDIAILGGIGININKFFVDMRISGYPRSSVWQTFTSEGISQRVKVSRELTYSLNVGFFF